MPAHIVAGVDVHKPAQYEQYKRLSSLAISAFDAKVLVRGGECRKL